MKFKDVEIRKMITIMADTSVDEIPRLSTEYRIEGLHEDGVARGQT